MMPPGRDAAEPTAQANSAALTRQALVHAGLKLFGAKGFAGTSTRDIAALAKANIGSIAYHFGGKEGLRAACADYIVELMRGLAAQAFGPDFASVRETDGPTAEAELRGALERLVSFMIARPESGEIVQFMLRELSQPTAALDTIYAGVFEPTHRRLCQLWQAITGEAADSERTKITIFMMIGQIIYFRIAREPVMRRLGWSEIGRDQAAAVLAVAKDNIEAVIAARKGRTP